MGFILHSVAYSVEWTHLRRGAPVNHLGTCPSRIPPYLSSEVKPNLAGGEHYRGLTHLLSLAKRFPEKDGLRNNLLFHVLNINFLVIFLPLLPPGSPQNSNKNPHTR